MSDEEVERIANRVAELVIKKLGVSKQDEDLPKLLSRKQASEYLGFSPRGFDKVCQGHRFPGPIRPNGGDPYWKRSDIDRWLERTLG